MAVTLNKFVITSTVTLPAVAQGTITAGEPGTGAAAGFGSQAGAPGTPASSYGNTPLTFLAGTAIMLDNGTPSALYTQLNGLGALRAYVAGQDDVGHAALSN